MKRRVREFRLASEKFGLYFIGINIFLIMGKQYYEVNETPDKKLNSGIIRKGIINNLEGGIILR